MKFKLPLDYLSKSAKIGQVDKLPLFVIFWEGKERKSAKNGKFGRLSP